MSKINEPSENLASKYTFYIKPNGDVVFSAIDDKLELLEKKINGKIEITER